MLQNYNKISNPKIACSLSSWQITLSKKKYIHFSHNVVTSNVDCDVLTAYYQSQYLKKTSHMQLKYHDPHLK